MNLTTKNTNETPKIQHEPKEKKKRWYSKFINFTLCQKAMGYCKQELRIKLQDCEQESKIDRSQVSFNVASIPCSFHAVEPLGSAVRLMDERATNLTFVDEAVLWDSPVHMWHFRNDEAIRPWQATRYIPTLICLVHGLN